MDILEQKKLAIKMAEEAIVELNKDYPIVKSIHSRTAISSLIYELENMIIDFKKETQ